MAHETIFTKKHIRFLMQELEMTEDAFWEGLKKSEKADWIFTRCEYIMLEEKNSGKKLSSRGKIAAELSELAHPAIPVMVGDERILKLAESYAGDDQPEIAFHLYLAAAMTGNDRAAFKTGQMYLQGMGIPADKGQAVYWLHMAVEAERAEAMTLLGEVCEAEDPQAALEWYKKAVLKKDSQAAFKAAELLERMAASSPDTDKALCRKAYKMYKKAYRLGHARAAARLGRCNLEGIGREISYAKALKYFLSGSEEDKDPCCDTGIGEMYLTGKGVDPDPALGIRYLLKGGWNKDHGAWAVLGRYFEQEGNLQKAVLYYGEGAHNGNAACQEALKRLEGPMQA